MGEGSEAGYPEQVHVVPPVRGKSLAGAANVLAKSGLVARVDLDRFFGSDSPVEVGGTFPPEGSPARGDQRIELLPFDSALLAKDFTEGFPDVVGLNVDEGIAIVRGAGYTMLEIVGNYSRDVSENVIASTRPLPGHAVTDWVGIFYSLGEAPFEPPVEPTEPPVTI